MLTLSDPGYELWRRFNEGQAGLADHPVLPRWRRVNRLRSTAASADLAPHVDGNFAERRQRSADHFARGHELLRAGADELARRGCGLFLADQDGVLIAAHNRDKLGGADFQRRFPDGAHWDERTRGTNAIGTALAEDAPVAVIGRAHSDPDAHGLVCYAAPIHDVDGQIVAVLDCSGPVESADPLLGVTVEGLASAFEGMLRARALEELADRVKVLELEQNEALRASETFVATISHDLRSPLSVVMNGAETLGRSDDSQRERVAERIRSSARRMLGLVDQLSDLARGRLAGGIALSGRAPVDLALLASRVLDELRVLHPGRTIQLDKTGDGRGHWDAVRIEQVAANLIGNALRHGARAQPVRVEIDGGHPGEVTLTVSNAGEIDPAILPHIFDPFRSGSPRRTGAQGLGLGLYIVQQVVQAHDGYIDVVTRNGSTLFRVNLPRTVGNDR